VPSLPSGLRPFINLFFSVRDLVFSQLGARSIGHLRRRVFKEWGLYESTSGNNQYFCPIVWDVKRVGSPLTCFLSHHLIIFSTISFVQQSGLIWEYSFVYSCTRLKKLSAPIVIGEIWLIVELMFLKFAFFRLWGNLNEIRVWALTLLYVANSLFLNSSQTGSSISRS
jgi:hypothetical protein